MYVEQPFKGSAFNPIPNLTITTAFLQRGNTKAEDGALFLFVFIHMTMDMHSTQKLNYEGVATKKLTIFLLL